MPLRASALDARFVTLNKHAKRMPVVAEPVENTLAHGANRDASEYLESDVLIIGTGIAGATVALTLADAGIPVTLVTRARAPEDSNTLWAQGGIIYQGVEDS